MHVPANTSAPLIAFALALGLTVSPSHGSSVQDEPPQATEEHATVSGTFLRTETFQPDRADLCVTECLREEEADYSMALSEVTEDGSFRFDRVPVDSTPRIAVRFTTYSYSMDGSRIEQRTEGYLAWHDEELLVVEDFDDADIWPVVEDLGELPVLVPEPMKWVRGRVTSVAGSILGPYVTFTYRAKKVQKGSRILAVAYGCGGKAVARTRVRGKSGRFKFRVETTLDRVARHVPLEITISKKGRYPYRHTDRWGPMPDRPKKC